MHIDISNSTSVYGERELNFSSVTQYNYGVSQNLFFFLLHIRNDDEDIERMLNFQFLFGE